TAESNIFQKSSEVKKENVHSRALEEFDLLVKKLRENRVYVIVLQDSGMPSTPDSIFPNNWISFHPGKMILYPMLAENRRMERRNDWIELLKHTLGISEVKNFSEEESKGKFLEGTGSLVLNRKNKIAYANLSSRTNFELLKQWCDQMHFELISFKAQTSDDKEIYHTNVLMAIGEETAVICGEVIRDVSEKKKVLS